MLGIKIFRFLMKKIFVSLLLSSLVLPSFAMYSNYRVEARKKHERDRCLTRTLRHVAVAPLVSVPVDDIGSCMGPVHCSSKLALGLPRKGSKSSICGNCGFWGKPFFILACCSMIVGTQALSKDNPYCDGFLKPHELGHIRGYEAVGNYAAAQRTREYYELYQSCRCEREDYIEKISNLEKEVAKLKKALHACEKLDL